MPPDAALGTIDIPTERSLQQSMMAIKWTALAEHIQIGSKTATAAAFAEALRRAPPPSLAVMRSPDAPRRGDPAAELREDQLISDHTKAWLHSGLFAPQR
ncbi:hypothetical protein HNR60_004217 [Rhodopseudomonas rhenobacensis]|uniref:Uncharacterized protein n=1 Tax=Rhodopseudomonas rhenobacensis TaxID=87461 RepID=A0A7W7Z7N8_9BRAD|nr:hypothetical protein [Rhodopseudomonas rhenobacensis]MBB5049439.1 hypothetical protein [Rhodopseudomonas rhenobacensis]